MRKRAKGWIAALFWLIVWATCAFFVGKPLLLPGPVETIRTLISLMRSVSFWVDTVMTMLRILTGFLSAVILGIGLGALCHYCAVADTLLSPLRQIIRATPVSSFIILVLLWLKIGIVPAFISFLMVLPIIWTSIQEGLSQVDGKLMEMAHAYKLPRGKIARHIIIPSIMPYLMTSCVTGLGFAWKSGIAAEVIARPLRAIGSNLQNAKVYLETPELFAWTGVIVVLSMLLEKALLRIADKAQRRRQE